MIDNTWPPFKKWFRPAAGTRSYTSGFLEEVAAEVAASIPNLELRTLFLNCFMNTLDTTTNFSLKNGDPSTYVVTGDIEAMWLRDSTLQMRPYLEFVATSDEVNDLIMGLINRQSDFIRLDPYANAFYDTSKFGIHRSDLTEMRPGVHERKWELDSLTFHLDLVCAFSRKTDNLSIFNEAEIETIGLILETLRIEQRPKGSTPYLFDRVTANPIDTLSNSGRGPQSGYTGMVHSAFRPSDDACEYPFHIPSNLYLVKVLSDLMEILFSLNLLDYHQICRNLVQEIRSGIENFGIRRSAGEPEIYYYEVDGLGNGNIMDDANIPNLVSLPYLGVCEPCDELYQATRAIALSGLNPFFYSGYLGSGIGSPHTPEGSVWPISLITEVFTTSERDVWRRNLRLLIDSSCQTGLLHESFNISDPSTYSRPWFAWCNSFFGELILHIWREDPDFLRQFA